MDRSLRGLAHYEDSICCRIALIEQACEQERDRTGGPPKPVLSEETAERAHRVKHALLDDDVTEDEFAAIDGAYATYLDTLPPDESAAGSQAIVEFIYGAEAYNKARDLVLRQAAHGAQHGNRAQRRHRRRR